MIHLSSQLSFLEGYRDIFRLRSKLLFDLNSRVKASYSAPNAEAPYPLDWVVDKEGNVALWETAYDLAHIVETVEKALAHRPPVTVDVKAVKTSVPPGGSLGYSVTAANNGDGVQSFVAWAEEILPDGQRNTLWGPYNTSLPPKGTVTVNFLLTLPGNALPGPHSLKVKVGPAHGDAWDVGGHDFIVN